MRQQHYRFAHQVMVELVLRDPEMWMAQAGSSGLQMLQQTWAMAGQGLAPHDCVQGALPTIEYVGRGPDIHGYLITLPAPESANECYFIAVVAVGNNQPRYYLAERGMDKEDGTPRAFLAEWKSMGRDRMRIHGADLPEISAAAFVDVAVASAMASPAAAVPKKKSKKVPLLIGCGCLVPIVFGVIVGGCLFYHESLRELNIPTSEVASVPIHPNQSVDFSFKWDGHGYAFNNVWLVVEDGTKDREFTFSGEFSCRPIVSTQRFHTSLEGGKSFNVEKTGKDGFSAWIFLGDTYLHGSSRPLDCQATVNPIKGTWSKARIVVTQRQRPSDWIAN